MIEFKNVSKRYKDKTILKDISIRFDDDGIICLIGESGCGKTTTLKMINRLITPTMGSIFIDGEDITKRDVIKLRRNIGYVIQQTGLFPHMTIKENIELIPKIEKVPKQEIIKRTYEVMEMVGLDAHYLDCYPNELSGGQQQRVGIARALATNSNIILMDEPFSALDPITRSSLQDELLRVQDQFHKTIIFVTHDMDEAIKIADKIAIMNDGEIIQYGTPEEILKHPKNDFVRSFVGKKRIWSVPQYIKVEDIMVNNPITILPQYSCFYCLNKMRMYKVDSLIVVNKKNKLIGVLYADMLKGTNIIDKKAIDFTEKNIVFANPDEDIVTVLDKINENNLSSIPVVDDDKILVGLLTKSMLLVYLSQQFKKGGNPDE